MLFAMSMMQNLKTFLFFAGYGVDSDFRNLVSSCPSYEHSVKHLARFVDLCPLSKQVRQSLICPSQHSFSQDLSKPGLFCSRKWNSSHAIYLLN